MAFTWNQVRDVVDVVLDLPPQERSQYLDQACPDPALRRYVDSLVLSYDRAGSFLELPASAVQNLLTATVDEELWLGQRLGPYEIIEQIGRGGMGSVYRAVRVDDQYHKQVAIKLVKPGFQTAFALSRLRAERQILANLEHPGIGRLIDGGTTESGVPYFVMELVEGQPIDQYCDSHRLPIRERLRLFRTVCSAVEYAHQNLVVHRDLKPGNVLITKEGAPKLLDFGIAKILTPESAPLETEPSIAFLRILTPEYASPEQVTGAPISTATDVYSLGVVLYVLLTGHRPYEVDARRPDQMAATICHTDPPKPSVAAGPKPHCAGSKETTEAIPESIALARGTRPDKLRRQLAGDLDNIVLKALRKEPERRYGSVEQLSQDIRRHIEGLPVSARKETWGYRSQKFILRNKVALAAFALFVLSLAAGLIATLHQARVARAERARAERRFDDVRKLANSLIFEVHDGVANLPGSTPVRNLIMQRAAQYLDLLAKDASGDAGLQVELAGAYIRLAQVQGSMNSANLGDLAGAEQTYLKAQALLQAVLAKEPLRDDANGFLARSNRLLAYLYVATDRCDKAAEAAQKALAANRGLALRHPGDDFYQQYVPAAWQTLADAHECTNNPQERNERAQALQLSEQILSRHPNDLISQRDVALAEKYMGTYLANHGALVKSLSHYQRALGLDEKRAAAEPQNALAQLDVSFDLGEIANYYYQNRDWKRALQNFQQVLSIRQRLAAADPKNVQLRERIVYAQRSIGNTEIEMGRLREAREALQGAIDSLKLLAAQNSGTWYNREYLGTAYMGLGRTRDLSAAHASPGQARRLHAQACAYYAKADDAFRPVETANNSAASGLAQDLKDLENLMKHCRPTKPLSGTASITMSRR